MSQTIIAAAQRLADVLARENEALKRMDFAAAVALVPAKEAALADLTTRPGDGVLAPPLAALGQQLADLAIENQTLLERAIAVQTRIVRIVARACAPPGAIRYGGHGGRHPSSRTAAVALSTRA